MGFHVKFAFTATLLAYPHFSVYLMRTFQNYLIALNIVTHNEMIIRTLLRLNRIRDGRTHKEQGEGRSMD